MFEYSDYLRDQAIKYRGLAERDQDFLAMKEFLELADTYGLLVCRRDGGGINKPQATSAASPRWSQSGAPRPALVASPPTGDRVRPRNKRKRAFARCGCDGRA